MRILFFMHSFNYDRLFEDALEELLARGHEVDVVFDRYKTRTEADTAIFAALRGRYPGLSYGPAPERSRAWSIVSRGLRADRDYLRYLEPEYAAAAPLRDRARERAHRPLVALASSRPLRSTQRRGRLARALGLLDRAVPLDPAVLAFVRDATPDVVIVTPLVNFGSPQDDYVRAARRLGIPVVLAVASWDNLTNKGLVREAPDLTLVWNDIQKREAVTLHHLPADRVIVTGAHSYDHWFDWRPSTSFEDFSRRVGFPDCRPFLLYVGSSSFIAPEEPQSVRHWLERLRATDTKALREVHVLVRPHPTNPADWEEAGLEELGARVWPASGQRLRAEESKAAYFDSLHHSRAVVGLNTSALVEAAIVGKPVLTLLEASTAGGQVGTLHFAHIADGVLRVARSWDEHVDQLVEAFEHGPDGREAAFVSSFVRPHGIDQRGAALFVQAVEGARSLQPEERASRAVAAVLRPAIVALALPELTRPARKRARSRFRRAQHRLQAARRL